MLATAMRRGAGVWHLVPRVCSSRLPACFYLFCASVFAAVYEQEITLSSAQLGALTSWFKESCANVLKHPGFLGAKLCAQLGVSVGVLLLGCSPSACGSLSIFWGGCPPLVAGACHVLFVGSATGAVAALGCSASAVRAYFPARLGSGLAHTAQALHTLALGVGW